MSTTTAVWFEIPATDLDRAIAFYEALFMLSLRRETIAGMELAIFPHEDATPGGALIKSDMATPSSDGVVIYLAAGGRIAEILASASGLGGAALGEAFALPDGMGTIAFIRDSEGNRIGLHQMA